MIKLSRSFAIIFSTFLFLFYAAGSSAQHKNNSAGNVKVMTGKQNLKKQNQKQKKELISEKKKRLNGYKKQEKSGKFDEPNMFAKFQKIIRTRDGEAAPNYSANYLMEELNKAEKQKRLYKTNTLSWIERGPGNVSGRTRGIIVDKADQTNKTWFAGSVGGGIWKTTNSGSAWENITPHFPNLATTVLAQASSNHDIIYCGTGEGFFNADAVNGAGIFKSVDHGKTWTQLTTTANFDFKNINRIIIDPANANIIIACTNQGTVQRSTDGGTTWNRGTFSNNVSPGRIQDLKADPSNFSIQYCAVNNDGVYKSTDKGLTWVKSSAEITTDGRIEIAVSDKNPNYIYASCEVNNGKSALYVSKDKATTWFPVNSSDGVTKNWFDEGYGPQGWYDNTIAVHPYDEKTVFIGGINIWKAKIIDSTSSPRKATFTRVTDATGSSGKPYVHVDHHSIVIIPISSPESFWIVNGNDGGVAYSTDSGTTWRGNSTNNNINNGGYNTTQFYGVDKKPGANEYIGGTQDNGTWLSPIDPQKITAYTQVIGGDGFDVAWHHKDPNKIIGGSQYNSFYRTTDGGLTWESATKGLDDVGSGKGCFISKIAESNSDPDVIFTTGISGVWRSEDFGASWDKSTITGSTAWGYNDTSIPVAISAADPQVVWAGSRFTNSSGSSNLFISQDGGITFSPVSHYSEVYLGTITGIDTHPSDMNTAFITYSFSGAPKILRTTDLGNSWQDITGFGKNSTSSNGFPDVVTYCVLVMPYNTNIIWAGTEIGLFESIDNGVSWHPADNGLPSVCIWDMKIVDDQVVLATHGRGIWSVTIPQLSGNPLPYPPPVVTLSPIITAYFQGIDKSINLSAKLRSNYDSTLVMIDRQKAVKLFSTTAKDTTFKFAPLKYGQVSIQLISYESGKSYISSLKSLDLYDLKATQVVYSNAFDLDNGDFTGNGFSISTPTGFNSPMVNSLHPYGEMTDYYYNLLVPIKISDSFGFTNLEYDDIALVEPGEDGAPFGNSFFYDYVVAEGSKDGLNWLPFEDGYDCRFNPAWKTLYQTNTDPTASNYVHHKINMVNKFNPGDVIFVRFHLFSDPYTVGWGWAFDNLKIQAGATAVEKENTIPTNYSLSQNFPNPFNPVTTINFSLPQRSRVKLEIFDALGRVVTTLVNGELDAGSYKYNWNASNFASGTYIYRITANNFSSSKKLMLIK